MAIEPRCLTRVPDRVPFPLAPGGEPCSASTDVHRAVARRILACPYCHRPQAIPLQSVGFAVGCRNCHRVFRVTETGAVADVESARTADGAAPGRSPGDRVRSLLRGLRSVVIAVLALAVVAEAIRQLGSLGRGAVRRPACPPGREHDGPGRGYVPRAGPRAGRPARGAGPL